MRMIHATPARFPSWAVVTLLTLGGVGAVLVARGGSMFSPGGLNAGGRGGERGGIHAHAELGGNCSACHVPPWSSATMATRCLACHAGVREQIDGRHSLHGMLSAGTQCRSCHTEHNGPAGALTRPGSFDHDAVLNGTSPTCASCHAEPEVHKGKPGPGIRCHSTRTWTGVTFQAGKFNHDLAAFKLTGKHQAADCKS
jgi:hypothetical protein